ncbi:hypothetical protein ACO0LL_25890 [Undibacterium sp. TC4M20W]|uniref:hypothetical protein n=1 Tax=Undibacterium sp. TC4M20W TaxID=3413052 RepID=UPI003BF38919
MTDLVFEPFVGVGALKFGMSKSEVEHVQTTIDGIDGCKYQEGKLVSFWIYPSKVRHLFFSGEDVLQMGKLAAALYVAGHSSYYGQAQGGSLYFMDLGCAILQYESDIRMFSFFAREYDPSEPLMGMTLEDIESYYKVQTSGRSD